MSTDYDVICHTCKQYWHLGQSMAGRHSFGFGPSDTELQHLTLQFTAEHVWAHHDVRIIVFDEDYPDDYRWIEHIPDSLHDAYPDFSTAGDPKS